MKTDLIFLLKLHRTLTGEELNRQWFIDAVMIDGGVDIAAVPRQELEDYFDGYYTGDYRELGWAFNEMMACYSTEPLPLSADTLCRILFGMYILRDALKAERAEWEFAFGNMFILFGRIQAQLEKGDAMTIFYHCFETPSMRQEATECILTGKETFDRHSECIRVGLK